ncbi:MAG: pantetheine-phosphate adenylyltransferase [Thermoleophilia bacterium]|nr:pantetheine-phosphate adenylyltransferase [Thermoleophilia bacterium]
MAHRTALCPGTFDPPTLGHMDVVRRAARMFDEVVVAIVRAPQHKAQPLFSADERIELIEDALTDLPNVRVRSFSTLVVDVAKEEGATVLVKGLRAVSDFEWEFQMAHLNAELAPELETAFVMSYPDWSFVSSSGVREVAAFGGDVSKYVTPRVAEALRAKFPEAERS